MNFKPWQMAVVVLGLLVGGGSIFYNLAFSGQVDLDNTVRMVDVETGELFEFTISLNRTISVPARRTQTKQIALMRIIKDEAGQWHVPSRDMALLPGLDKDVPIKAIDPETGKVLVPVGSFRSYTPPQLP